MKHLIAPSILSADFLNLGEGIDMINRSSADWIHVDVMDGMFVPNISFGFPIIKQVNKVAQKPLDVHLMIVDPDRYLADFEQVGADILTVHYEACNHLHRTIHRIKELGMQAGVSLNPHTPVHVLEDIIADCDLVLLMSVNPGFGGQGFIENIIPKVRALKELIARKKSPALIEIDGGVNMETGRRLIEAGADVLVAGSFVFKSDDPLATIDALKRL